MAKKKKAWEIVLIEELYKFCTSSMVKRFLWNTGNGFLGLVVVYLSGMDWAYAPLVIAALNGITKEINKRITN